MKRFKCLVLIAVMTLSILALVGCGQSKYTPNYANNTIGDKLIFTSKYIKQDSKNEYYEIGFSPKYTNYSDKYGIKLINKNTGDEIASFKVEEIVAGAELPLSKDMTDPIGYEWVYRTQK